MTPTFGEQFVRGRSHVATWEGDDVFGSVRLDFSAPTLLVVDCVFGRSDPTQGVMVKLPRRKGSVAGVEGERLVLWDDNVFPLEVKMLAKRAPFEVAIWNVWQGPFAATTAFMGNAAMRVSEFEETHLVLECNAGPNPVTFTDLRITLSWPREVAARLLLPERQATHGT